MRKRQFLFRLFYSTSFTILLIIEILLLLISPGDIIYQSFAASRTLSIIAVAIVYVAVLLISAFIIATRFYTAHTQLTAIPRSHLPIRKGELGQSLRRLITTELARSASIAYHAHPREIRLQDIDTQAKETAKTRSKTVTWSLEHMRSWTDIEHSGWSSPCVLDLPNLEFAPVVIEFPHLIEAKAVSLAPSVPFLLPSNADTTDGAADPRAVELLQRPASMSLRQYINRLKELDMFDTVEAGNAASAFLDAYESSRFSNNELSEGDFRYILDNFTRIMQELKPPSEMALENFYIQSPSLSPTSSRSELQSRTSRKSLCRTSTTERRIQLQSAKLGAMDDQQPTPMSQSNTPFLTPMPYTYPASLSSGHAGDRSSDSSDSENDRSLHTAYTRSTRHARTTTTSRFVSAVNPERTDYGFNGSENSDDGGSVIRRTASNRSHRSDLSYATNESVIHRSDGRDFVLPLPMVDQAET